MGSRDRRLAVLAVLAVARGFAVPRVAVPRGVAAGPGGTALAPCAAASADAETAAETAAGAPVETRATPKGRELAARLKNVNVYLVGMMGAGKSAVGERVSRRLGSYAFVDTDATIESATGRAIPEIFAADGEAGFRAVESEVLDQVAAFVRLVIATGGGVVATQKNWASLRTGIVVWLDVPVPVLVDRIAASDGGAGRPLLGDDLAADLTKKLDERSALYAQADVRVAVGAGETPDDVADRVVDDVTAFIVANPPKTEPPPQ